MDSSQTETSQRRQGVQRNEMRLGRVRNGLQRCLEAVNGAESDRSIRGQNHASAFCFSLRPRVHRAASESIRVQGWQVVCLRLSRCVHTQDTGRQRRKEARECDKGQTAKNSAFAAPDALVRKKRPFAALVDESESAASKHSKESLPRLLSLPRSSTVHPSILLLNPSTHHGTGIASMSPYRAAAMSYPLCCDL